MSMILKKVIKEIEKPIELCCEMESEMCRHKAQMYIIGKGKDSKAVALCMACWAILSRQGIKIKHMSRG